MKDELMNIDGELISEKDIPALIQNKWELIKKVKEKSEKAKKDAQNAKDKVDKLKDVKWYKKKQAIEDVQVAVKQTSVAMGSLAEANEASFEYQQALGEMSKLLFRLGTGNLTATRTVMRQVRALLNDASEEELDDLAAEELYRVLDELMAQEDLAEKQKRAFEILKEQDEKISEQDDKISEQDVKISEQEYKIDNHDSKFKFVEREIKKVNEKEDANIKLISEQVNRISENEKKIKQGEIKDKQQDTLIYEQKQKSADYNERLSKGERKDQEQDKQLANQKQKDLEHDKKIEAGEKKDSDQDKIIGINTDKIDVLEARIRKLEGIIENQNMRIDELTVMLEECQNNEKTMMKKKWGRRVR